MDIRATGPDFGGGNEVDFITSSGANTGHSSRARAKPFGTRQIRHPADASQHAFLGCLL